MTHQGNVIVICHQLHLWKTLKLLNMQDSLKPSTNLLSKWAYTESWRTIYGRTHSPTALALDFCTSLSCILDKFANHPWWMKNVIPHNIVNSKSIFAEDTTCYIWTVARAHSNCTKLCDWSLGIVQSFSLVSSFFCGKPVRSGKLKNKTLQNVERVRRKWGTNVSAS